ncbi:hypothetical protein SO802_026384 [Lithocarpus litseifolius]|uniref:Uncharacterized protein n=1 Tax=Lithocarpus litseifolius TaxID=425828 RepID=A0AAW2C337_9ROSI
MPMADLYTYPLERKLVTPLFQRLKEGPLPLGFDSSKKCKHHFGAEGHTLEECFQLKNRVQDLIDKKLIQFDNAAAPNIITNHLPHPQEGNVNAIITVEERVLDFSLPSFPRKAMLQALVQESHLDLKDIGTLSFDWGICSYCDREDSHALFHCKMLRAQVQSLTERIGSRKDWDEYLLKCLGQIAPASSSLVVIEEIVETPTNPGSSDSEKGQVSPAIERFTPLILALPAVMGPTSSSV